MIESKIKKLIEQPLKDSEIILDKVEYIKEDNNWYLRITIDKIGDIDIDACVKAAEIINPILDKEDPIENAYILDVTSKERGDNDER